MIQVTRSSMPDFEEYVDEIRPLWDSHWLTNMGEKHTELERRLREYLGVPEIVLFTNGHLALEEALAVMELPEGSEVITTPFTFASTTHAIVRKGLKPVFCDIRESDFTLDPDKARRLITKNTSAIVPVHVYGNMCDVEGLKALADEYGLKLIYDAAHAFGVRYDGVSSACFGDISMFSFHATKVFNTIEGGALCFREHQLYEKLNDHKNFGIRNPEDVVFVGGNAKMNEFQAAMGICNLRHVDGEIAKRGRVDALYRELLGGRDGIRLLPINPKVTPNFAYFPVCFNGHAGRDEVYEELKSNGIIARKYFYPLTSDFECYRSLPASCNAAGTPVAAYAASHVLTLPMYADLGLDDAEKIADIVIRTCK